MDYHMSADEFRARGRELIDWIAEYWEQVADLDITPDLAPNDIRALLPDRAPERPESFDEIIADLDRVVMPGLAHWQSPGWFAFFPANASFPAILGELVAAGLGQQGMLWATSPATTEVESHVLDWLVDLMGLPQSWKTSGPGGGVLQMSASDSTHTALVVARQRVGATGVPIERMTVYTSVQAHSSIEKGARVAGFSHIRKVEVDRSYAMDPDALTHAIEIDLADGLHPVFVCSTVGTTGTTAVDPVRSIGDIALLHGLWQHR